MTTVKREIPRDGDGRRLCEHCLTEPLAESLGTKPRRYCSRNCRQRAYEARKQRDAIEAAVAVAEARAAKSRDYVEPRNEAQAKSRDFAKVPQVAPGIPVQPVEQPVLPVAWRAPVRRGLSRRRSEMTASPMPLLFDDTQVGPDDGRADTE